MKSYLPQAETSARLFVDKDGRTTRRRTPSTVYAVRLKYKTAPRQVQLYEKVLMTLLIYGQRHLLSVEHVANIISRQEFGGSSSSSLPGSIRGAISGMTVNNKVRKWVYVCRFKSGPDAYSLTNEGEDYAKEVHQALKDGTLIWPGLSPAARQALRL